MSGSGPERLDLRGVSLEGEGLRAVVDYLGAGRVLAYPTETVYGFGAACDTDGVAAVTRLKDRESSKPFLVLLPGPGHASALTWTAPARELAEAFWPGALTLILGDPAGTFPPGIRSARGTVGVRVSPHPLVRALMEAWDAPLISTSVNAPGQAPARSGVEVLDVSRELGAGPELLVLDAGTLPPSDPSTIVDCAAEPGPRVVREGSVPVERLRCVLPALGGHGG